MLLACKDARARCGVPIWLLVAMAAFVLLHSKLIQLIEDSDGCAGDLGYTEILVNVDNIRMVFWDKIDTVMILDNGNTLYIKERIHEVYKIINRASALYFPQ
jgi:hypothetical protein